MPLFESYPRHHTFMCNLTENSNSEEEEADNTDSDSDSD